MKRRFLALGGFLAGTVLALVLLAGTALATLTEVGHSTQPATPTCPANPCLAVSRTTGFQSKAGTDKGVMVVPRDGRIVAWTITLGKPSTKQISFFDTNEGGPAEAGITLLRPGKRLFFRTQAQTPLVQLQPYFGMTAQFPLVTTLAVKKGWVVALTVPTWAPALSVGFDNTTAWRSSRDKKTCSNTTTQTAQQRTMQLTQYGCLYKTARLTYSATLISTP
ncbi:MAG TPA: hypothetical protein VGY97_03690 [Solirubrobacteraceae bacterium]|nr:hypothetical protein [Solirubrobacteraceae bacterium]